MFLKVTKTWFMPIYFLSEQFHQHTLGGMYYRLLNKVTVKNVNLKSTFHVVQHNHILFL